MYVRHLILSQYRNLSQAEINLVPGLNIIVGANAQGKTNLLEGLAYPRDGKSFRGHTDNDVVQVNKEWFRIELKLATGISLFPQVSGCEEEHELTAFFGYGSVTGGKRHKEIHLNGKRVAVIESIQFYPVVTFLPDDLFLIKGSPYLRRAFLDNAIGALEPAYIKILARYRQSLLQRNSLLQRYRLEKNSFHHDLKEVWDREFIRMAAAILVRRLRYLEVIEPLVRDHFLSLTGSADKLSCLELVYKPKGFSLKPETGTMNSSDLLPLLERCLETLSSEETRAGLSLFGPHRDDLEIKIFGRSARVSASQGQQRSIAVSFKMAERDLLSQVRNEDPILILDDVCSELDPQLRRALLKRIMNKGQVFLSCADSGIIASKEICCLNIGFSNQVLEMVDGSVKQIQGLIT